MMIGVVGAVVVVRVGVGIVVIVVGGGDVVGDVVDVVQMCCGV